MNQILRNLTCSDPDIGLVLLVFLIVLISLACWHLGKDVELGNRARYMHGGERTAWRSPRIGLVVLDFRVTLCETE